MGAGSVNAKVGVLVANLGSPAAPTYGEVRSYLQEFLSDRRVIQLSPLIWQPILHLFVLSFRPSKTARLYGEIWHKATNESPLVFHTRETAEALSREDDDVEVAWAMRYGQPAIEDAIAQLFEKGCERIVVLPLYPQFSRTTTSSIKVVLESLPQSLLENRSIDFIEDYHDCPAYIDALAASVTDHLTTLDFEPEKFIVSFHGIPLAYHRKGDPYVAQCEKTFGLLAERLPKGTPELVLTFQSRFGFQKWMEPYTDETLVELAQAGTKRVMLIAPGFAADCIETLEELDIQGKEAFIANGGEHYTRVPCLNASSSAIALYRRLAGERFGDQAAMERPAD